MKNVLSKQNRREIKQEKFQTFTVYSPKDFALGTFFGNLRFK